jgi:hypothetical protein
MGPTQKRQLYQIQNNKKKKKNEFYVPGWIRTHNPSKRAGAEGDQMLYIYFY